MNKMSGTPISLRNGGRKVSSRWIPARVMVSKIGWKRKERKKITGEKKREKGHRDLMGAE